MKKYFLYPLLGLIGIILLFVMIAIGVVFFKPTLVINTQNLELLLNKTQILKKWSWKSGEMGIDWISWNKRHLQGEFKDLCIEYSNEGMDFSTCLETLSWNFNLGYEFGDGIIVENLSPLLVRSAKTNLLLKETTAPKEEEVPLDIWGYWSMLWNPFLPDMDARFDKITITSKGKDQKFDVILLKGKEKLMVKSMDFTFLGYPQSFKIVAPPKYELPADLKTSRPLYFRDIVVNGIIKPDIFSLDVDGALESIEIDIKSKLKLPLTDTASSIALRKKALLGTTAHFHLENTSGSLNKYAPSPFNELPAPLNVMDGPIDVRVSTENMKEEKLIKVNAATGINLLSDKQALVIDLQTLLPLNLETFKPGEILLAVDFKKVIIQLPRLSKKSPPPQFVPDGRIKNTSVNPAKEEPKKKEEKPSDVEFKLQATENPLALKTNLLDEPLRLNFDLFVTKGALKEGYVSMLPLNTTVFKRPIKVRGLRVNFQAPLEPVIKARINFPLPEYKITMDLEGPVSKPRYYFSSVPPLSQNDIYAVLLFGRPMDQLDPNDKSSASKTNRILAQGLLSLSVLYFLAGSPVEYVGYDPDSKEAVAQIGLGKKNSLRVGGGSDGVSSTGIRRSLGKGWYLDTSVQKSTESVSKENDYGALIERIIAY